MKLLNCRVAAGRRYVTSGTDGFGRSDTRAVLRSFFQVDAHSIVDRALAEQSITFFVVDALEFSEILAPG